MLRNSYPGKFIVFEGLDGSGQSTQAGLLKNFLVKKGCRTVLTKESTMDSAAGRLIRKVLDGKKKIPPKKLQELYAEDREQHLKKVVVPNLKKGKIVISDRYFFSSFAYGSLDAPLSYLLKINDKFLMPDLAFFINTKPETCVLRIERRGKKKTLFERKEKLKKVHQNYKKIIKKFRNVIIIDGEGSIKETHRRIIKKISNYAQ
ncbi:MAG: dTMP kinase [Candidatus Paceibacterota bacterium]